VREDFVHVVPLNDLREHEVSVGCWCHPTPLEDDPSVYVHHSLDGREKYESGELRLQ
jgi:hypothetical protein